LILFTPDGSEALRMRSRDFADRPTDDDVFAAGGRLGLPAIAPGAAPPGAEPVDALDALRTDAFGPYFRGIRFAPIPLAGQLEDPRDVAETVALSDMAASFLAPWKQRRQIAGG
jgi:hypothetical protein